jgi:crotonobetaine/carnitine-CoA ligase
MSADYVEGLFGDAVALKCEKAPDFQVFTFENGENLSDEIVTNKDLFVNSCKLAKALQSAGIGKGDNFSLVMRNHPEFIYTSIAASMIGAVVVPIDPRSKGSKLSYQIRDSKSKGIIFTNEFAPEVEKSLSELKDVKVIGVAYKEGFEKPILNQFPSLNEILEGPEVGLPANRNRDINSPSQIIYTSGTTGDPKGVVLLSSRTFGSVYLAQSIFKFTAEDKTYTGLSLTHGNAQTVNMIPAIMLNIPAVISTKFTKKRIWDICRKHGCTTFSLLGGMMMGIYSEPAQANDADNPVRVVLSAGTPISIWADFEKRFNVKIHEWYGAIEGGFAHNAPGEGPIGSFGKPVEGFHEIKIVREDDSECAPGEVGELVVIDKQNKVEVEYFGNKKASEEKTRGGVLRMGDMCHKDEKGWLFFDYRKGGGLRRQGDFILPGYVEKALADLPEVNDVCVYGIPAESGAPGESDIVAAVVLTPDAKLDVEEISKALSKALETSHIPQFLQVVSEIPKTASEKNLERVLRAEFSKEADNAYRLKES